MSARRTLLALLVLSVALALVVLGGLACGKKDKNPTAPTTHEFPLSDGTWMITTISRSTGGACSMLPETTTTEVVVSGGQENGQFFPDCQFNVTGNRFSQSCVDTIQHVDNCLSTATINGSGTKTAMSFTATYNIVVATTGSCTAVYDCQYEVKLTGTKAPVQPGYVSSAGPSPFTRIIAGPPTR
jgi:hypothetical protein